MELGPPQLKPRASGGSHATARHSRAQLSLPPTSDTCGPWLECGMTWGGGGASGRRGARWCERVQRRPYCFPIETPFGCFGPPNALGLWTACGGRRAGASDYRLPPAFPSCAQPTDTLPVVRDDTGRRGRPWVTRDRACPVCYGSSLWQQCGAPIVHSQHPTNPYKKPVPPHTPDVHPRVPGPSGVLKGTHAW